MSSRVLKMKPLGLLLGILIALACVPSMLFAETAPTRVAVVDTENLPYPGNPIPNRDLIRDEVVSRIFPQSETRLFSVRLSTENGSYSADLEGQDILAFNPDFVLVHWTSFPPPEGLGYCVPKGAEGSRNCAAQALAFLFSIHRANPEASIIIYSRARNLCVSDFQFSLARLLIERISDDEEVVGAFMQSIGFVVMRPDLDRQNFSDHNVVDSIRRLFGYLSSSKGSLLRNDPRDGLCGWDGE